MQRIITVVLLAALYFPVIAHERLVAIEGQGTIEAVPDIIRIEMRVYKLDLEDIARAKSYVDDLSSKAAAALIANGVREQDISSSSMAIRLDERYDDNDNALPPAHVASRDIEVIVRDVKSYSTVVQALVDAGINDIFSVEPDVSDYDALQRQALAGAVRDARDKAELLANELGATLGKVHEIDKERTHRNFGGLEEVVVTALKRSDVGTQAVLYEFQPGPVELRANVYVEFIIE